MLAHARPLDSLGERHSILRAVDEAVLGDLLQGVGIAEKGEQTCLALLDHGGGGDGEVDEPAGAEAAERLDRVLTGDPGSGVARHADAGYEQAIDNIKSQLEEMQSNQKSLRQETQNLVNALRRPEVRPGVAALSHPSGRELLGGATR